MSVSEIRCRRRRNLGANPGLSAAARCHDHRVGPAQRHTHVRGPTTTHMVLQPALVVWVAIHGARVAVISVRSLEFAQGKRYSVARGFAPQVGHAPSRASTDGGRTIGGCGASHAGGCVPTTAVAGHCHQAQRSALRRDDIGAQVLLMGVGSILARYHRCAAAPAA